MKPVEIANPLIIVHQPDGPAGKIRCHLHGSRATSHRHFALYIADIIGHVATCYRVPKEEVLALVIKELDKPTTDIEVLFNAKKEKLQ